MLMSNTLIVGYIQKDNNNNNNNNNNLIWKWMEINYYYYLCVFVMYIMHAIVVMVTHYSVFKLIYQLFYNIQIFNNYIPRTV